MRVDDHSTKGYVGLKDESFERGNMIEAYVSHGHAESVSLIRRTEQHAERSQRRRMNPCWDLA